MALVNIVTKIELDVYDFNLTPSLVKTIALDSGIRTIEAVIREKGQLYDIGQDATVVLTVMRPDKTGVQITGETYAFVMRSGDDQGVTVYGTKVDLTQAALAIKGKLPAQFKITSGDRTVRTEIFTIENGQALDADITDWAEYQGYNLDEMAQSIEDLSSDVAEIQQDVSDLKSGLTNIEGRVEALEEGGMGSGLTEAVKVALLQIAQKVAYVDAHGQDYYGDLYDALYPPATLVGIDAVYTQSGTVLTTDTLDSLKADLVVTATYTDQTTETVTNYTLSGALSEGTSTITVSYGGKTDTFTVTVTYSPIPSEYTELEYVHANDGAYLNTGYTPNANTAMEYKVSVEELKASGHIASAVNWYALGIRLNGRLVNRCGTEASDRSTYTVGTPVEVSMYMDGSNNITVDGDVVLTCTAGSATSGIMSLFTYDNTYNYYTNAKMYYMRIYENGVLVKNYLPCMRNSDNKVGFYEAVSGTFAGSSDNRYEFTAS